MPPCKSKMETFMKEPLYFLSTSPGTAGKRTKFSPFSKIRILALL